MCVTVVISKEITKMFMELIYNSSTSFCEQTCLTMQPQWTENKSDDPLKQYLSFVTGSFKFHLSVICSTIEIMNIANAKVMKAKWCLYTLSIYSSLSFTNSITNNLSSDPDDIIKGLRKSVAKLLSVKRNLTLTSHFNRTQPTLMVSIPKRVLYFNRLSTTVLYHPNGT